MSLDKNKRVRRGHRAFVTKTIQAVNEVCQHLDGTLLEKEKLQSLKITLSDKKAVLQKQDEAILEQVEKDDEIDSEIFESSEIGESISRAVVKIELALNSFNMTVNSTESNPNSSNLSETASVSTSKVRAKLPKLTLKRFGGDPTQWHSFWDSFSAAVHNNDGVSKVDKFNYLKSLVEGQAASAIEGLSLTKENYDDAIKLLEDRFANPQIIVSSHMDALLKLKAIEDVGNLLKIRHLFDQIETHVRSLQNLGISSQSYGSLLIPVIVSKLPEEMQLIISRKLEKGNWDVTKFLEEFKIELEARERCSMMNTTPIKKDGATRNKEKLPFTASTLISGKSTPFIPSCTYCNQRHTSLKCYVITEVSARRAILRKKGKCFSCLRSGHLAKNCPSKFNCQKCDKRHHTSLCEEEKKVDHHDQESAGTSGKISTNINPSAMCVNSNTSVLLQTAQAFVGDPNGSGKKVKARIIFDSCSQRSYITQHLQQTLKLPPIGSDNLQIQAFGDKVPTQGEYKQVQFSITTIDGMELYAKGYVVPNICSPISSQTIKEAVERYPYLRGLQLAETPTSSDQIKVDILIGADYYWNFVTNITRRGTSSGPVAIWTKLGWVLSGPVINQCENDPKCSVNLNITHVLQIEASTVLPEKDPTVENLLNKFWDLESLGIKKEEPSVYDKFTQEVRFNGDRYEAKLPFKEDHPLLPDNYTICVKRLGSLVKRLQTTPSRLQEYQRVIQDQISQGVVEPVWKEEVKPPGDVHYLPHREVVRMDKSTTKLRVVYDASAKSNGPSLNDCLFIGPPLTPLIFDILARFRMHPIAVTADIEKAFLNISIAPEHRDFLRFLWVDDPSSKAPQVQVLRFTRVVFGLTSSPFILNATLNHHLSHYVSSDPEFVKEVSRSLYVDDFASGSFNVHSALELSEKVKIRFLEGGFNMRKWQSNSQELMKAYQENATFSESKEFVGQPDAATDKDGAENHTLPTVERDSNPRVLGQIWLPSDDKLKTEFTKAFDGIRTEVVTKRIVLSVAAKFYDPLGLISPIVLMFKLLFQELCKSNLKWDDPLESNLNQKWQSMINGLKEADSVSLNRCYCKELYKDDVKSIQLHGFGDASESAYGACVYLRCEHESSVHCNLVASKTRVAPMVKQTIPRLELLSCLVSARLINSVKKAIGDMVKIHSETLWSDSTTALHWIRNTEKEYKPFVQNRVSEIRKLSSLENWRYCPTQQNPADVASRGVLATQLIHDDKWWYGPNYLQTQKELWPHQPFKETDDNSDYFRELKSPSTKSTVAVASTRISQEHNIEQLLNPTKFSSIVTILRITAYILRFVKNLRSRLNGTDVHQGPLTAEEITAAEKIWIKRIQVALQKLERYKKMKESLALFEDEEGIVRCHGRIEAAPLPYDTKFPILLPTDHHLTRLIVLRSHKDVIHNGVRETLTQVRARFWITRGRQVVKKILSSCTVCRKLEGKPYGSPVSPPLPEFRLSCDFAFTRIGVDYAGPLYVKDVYSKTKDMHKAYISLYTCTSSRAIHLDLVPDATSETFVRSFKRFIGRRGIPSLVVSDNGKTFKGPELRSFVATKNIKWRYIVERSPWWGGFYERMVRSVKRCLKKILSNARLNYEELYTVLVQIEAVLNSRPLTYVYQEGDEPLTPSHLVLGRRLLSATPELENEHKGNESSIKREKHLKIVLDHFWRRWKSEYLTELREHHKPNPKEGPKIQIGDTVSIYEDKIKRLNWNMGLVEQLITGKDGKVRAAVVRVINKGGKLTQIRRPVQKLYPVELQNDDEKEKNLPGFPITYVEQAQQENI